MRIRLPTPLHGWRVFIGEVGTIVLGVVLALGAEQTVQWVHDQQDADQLRNALNAELANDRARWEQIRAQDRCALRRLAALERWANSASTSARLTDAYDVFLWNMQSSAWDIAKSSPAVDHLSLQERLTYASLYAAIDNWRPFFWQEGENIDALRGFLATADQTENHRQIRFHITQARSFIRRRQRVYAYFFSRFDELGIRADATKLTIAVDLMSMCRPLVV